jgi:hypothetical protein
MFKKIAAAVIALGFMATSAFSATVFEYGVGFWTIKGYVGDGDASCVVSTQFTNGGQLNVNVFPRTDGTQYTTMTVYNPDWAPTPKLLNESFTEAIVFRGSKFGTVRLNGQFQIYGPRKVILRELSGDFSYYFIKARDMIVFPNTRDQINISLRGTQAVSNALDSCIATVLR